MAESNEVSDVPFTKQMKIATRKVHSLSDTLINAKVSVAFGSTRIWAEGLLVFYEVFANLEDIMDRYPDSLLAQLDFPGIRRKELFEKDLAFYLGAGWRSGYVPRPSVAVYIDRLQELALTEPELLLAYAYHMYMGLLFGGQILRRKRAVLNKIKFKVQDTSEGLAVTEVSGTTVASLRKKVTDATNRIAGDLDDSTRAKLIEESKRVFQMNDKIVRSIEGTTTVVLWKLGQLASLTTIIVLIAYLLKMFIFQ